MKTQATHTDYVQLRPATKPDASNARRMRVLLVDDDPAYSALCKRYLKKDPARHFEIHAASSAADAIARCLEQDYDCLVIDYQLPDSTGTQALDTLRETFSDSLPPAIILTADGGEEAATNAVRAGAMDFMSKRDVGVKSLRRVVNNAIDKGTMRRTLHRQNIEIREANLSLKQRNNEIRRFYHTVSHEVKTPLSAVREFISLVNDGVVGSVCEEQTELLNHALESCDQIKRQFDEMFDLARLESGRMQLQIVSAPLEDVLERSLASCASAARTRNVQLIKPDLDTALSVLMDSNRIVQVLSNLLGNAIKFTPEGGRVELQVIQNEFGQDVQLSVVDSGCGIDSAELEHVFERLYQCTSSDGYAQGGGLGLGLSIAYEIVRMHGQLLTASSTLNEGSTFSFQLKSAEKTVDTNDKNKKDRKTEHTVSEIEEHEKTAACGRRS